MNTKAKFLSLLFVILLSTSSCEKDLYNEPLKQNHKKNQAKNLTGSEALKIAKKLNHIMGNGNSALNINMARILSPIGEIQFDEIRQVIDTMGKVNYTFRVNHPQSSDEKFFNLVLQEKNEQSTVKLYEYTMDPVFAQQYKQTLSLVNYYGSVRSTTLQSNNPCPENDFLLIVGYPGGGSGGSGDGGSGGDNPGGDGPGGNGPGGGNSGNPNSGNLNTTIHFAVSISPEVEEEWVEVSQSPRYFRFAVQDNLGLDPDQPCSNFLTIGILSPIDACSKSFLDSLTYEQKLWLYNQQTLSTEFYSNIISATIGDDNDDCNEGKNQILKDGINAIIIDSCAVFVPTVFDNLITTTLPPCLDQVVNDIKTLQNGKFGQVIKTFAGNNPLALNFNWHVKTAPLSTNPIIAAETSFQSGIGSTTELNVNYINISTDLSLAKTLIHECFHAYLTNVYRYRNIDNNYVNLVNTYAAQFNNNTNDIHHHLFTIANITSHISNALKEYGVLKGYNLSQQFYDDMAWGGLAGTSVFNALPVGDRERILNTIEAEFENSNQNPLLIAPQGVQICP